MNPATCEIEACGVLAIGRCTGCGNAFCGAHQGYVSGAWRRHPQVNGCSACAARDEYAAAAPQRRWARAHQFMVEARDALRRSTPPEEFYSYRVDSHKHLLTRKWVHKRVRDTALGKCWVVGEFSGTIETSRSFGRGEPATYIDSESFLLAMVDDQTTSTDKILPFVPKSNGIFWQSTFFHPGDLLFVPVKREPEGCLAYNSIGEGKLPEGAIFQVAERVADMTDLTLTLTD